MKQILFISIFAILILSIVSISATTINNQYISVGNITVTGDGNVTLSNGANSNGVSSGTADVVVCRGTSIWDDYYKSIKWMSGCDVVCKSTSSDCSSILQNSISSNKNIVWASGNYPINLPTTGTAIDITSNNFTLNAYQVFLNVNYGNNHDEYAIYVHGTNNVNIYGLNIFGNYGCDSSNNCFGLLMHHNQNVILDDISVKGIKGFPISIGALGGNTTNFYIYNSYFEGAGVADTIGAGDSGLNTLNNVQIINSVVNQTFLNGTTDSNAIVFAGGTNIIIKGTTSYGSMVLGAEQPCYNSKIEDNFVYPINISVYGGLIATTNASTNNIEIKNNQIFNGNVALQGNLITLDNNYINVINSSYTGILINSNNNTITNNKVFGGLYSIDISSNKNSNIIKNNRLEGANSYYIRGTSSSYNDISSNDFIKNDNGGINAIIALFSFTESSFNNNNLYNYLPSSDFFAISTGCANLTLTNNQVFINKSFSDEYASINSGALNSTYVDKKTNYGSIIKKPCSTDSVFDGRYIQNGTAVCTCTGGAWKCWVMS